jgi:hypothetical protein
MVVLPIHGNAWVTRVRPKSAALLCATNSLRSGFSHHALDHVRGPGVRSSWRVSGANPSFGCGKGGESCRPWREASCQTCPRIPPVAVRAGHLVRLASGESWSRQEGKWSGANAPSGPGSVMGRSSSPRLSVAPAPWRSDPALPPAAGPRPDGQLSLQASSTRRRCRAQALALGGGRAEQAIDHPAAEPTLAACDGRPPCGGLCSSLQRSTTHSRIGRPSLGPRRFEPPVLASGRVSR